jgi:hypothetical protein
MKLPEVKQASKGLLSKEMPGVTKDPHSKCGGGLSDPED